MQELQHRCTAVSCELPAPEEHPSQGWVLCWVRSCTPSHAPLLLPLHQQPQPTLGLQQFARAALRDHIVLHVLCCHLNHLEPVQEGLHSPEDDAGGEVPEMRVLLQGDRSRQQPDLAWMGLGRAALFPAPTRNNVGPRSEQ